MLQTAPTSTDAADSRVETRVMNASGRAGIDAAEIERLPFDLSVLDSEGVFVNVDARGFGILDRRLDWQALGITLPRGSGDYIRWAVEGSLRRLRTETIDVYQMHEPDPETPIEETLGALNELVREGKVRFIGSSNYSAEQIEDADRVARDRGFARFVAAQNHYSFVHREIEDDVLPVCERTHRARLCVQVA